MVEYFGFSIEMQWFIVLCVFVAATIVQFIFYFGFYFRFIFRRHKPAASTSEPVSVIVCARNEAENLDNFLPSLLTQDYPAYEVIVVNDCSTDHTEEILDKYTKQYPHLRTSEIKIDKKFSHGKKLAVTIGIKAAKFDRLLFTDADCKPDSNQWISRMSARFSEEKSIVLGYGGHFARRGLLNKYIRFDTLFIALQYFSYALAGIPYMGVGRNLGYKRSLFYSGSGFTRHIHLASGDDDLFINENASKANTTVEYSNESHTRTDPKDSFNKWFFQKKRHFSTSRLYKPIHKFLLTLEPASRLLYYTAFVVSIIFIPEIEYYIAAVFGFRLIIEIIVIKKAMNRLNEKNLLLISLLFEPVSLFVNFCLLIASRIRPSNYQWK